MMDLSRAGAMVLASWLAHSDFAPAEEPATRGPVLVELFTSQGCSSCPPADGILAEMADRSDVVAISVHVDYWDYLGWRDAFGSPANTARQKAYAAALNERMVYTPQVIVAGREKAVGSRRQDVDLAIRRLTETPDEARISLMRGDGLIHVDVTPVEDGAKSGVVLMASISDRETVRISAGENAGREIEYRNVVRDWREIGRWNGSRAQFSTSVPEATDAVVIMLQGERSGPVYCVVRLPLY